VYILLLIAVNAGVYSLLDLLGWEKGEGWGAIWPVFVSVVITGAIVDALPDRRE